MDSIYLVVVVILLALAVSDLVVGVSNDAVNFLNSAIGSKAAPRYVIMTVASIGILLGSVFSSGMMEVARSGVFYPAQFQFHDVMMIFLAVMFTDVILLDMFNTFGLPTSTTVSLVFELLGSAVAVALVNIWDADTVQNLSSYINAGKAMGIISGILLSVVIAFTVGTLVMFITRLIFSFRYQKSFKYVGSLWCGIALTAISYFAVFKGLKGSTIMGGGAPEWMNQDTIVLLGMSFVFWSAVMWVFQWLFKWNILKITILAGTLSLALAFAGNDLVNFIGVGMAGLDSYQIASEAAANGVDISSMYMGDLSKPIKANPWILMLAGGIMVCTLWFSKKARTVSETEINLARQDVGVERFGSTSVSRALVRSSMNFYHRYQQVMPRRMQSWIEQQFRPVVIEPEEKAPFDLIRATVNLTVASILIAMATSLKLPLSTTYVTFMVAMGSSLADRAWGRETAVYRITGVLTVISGWFLTALIAFTVAFLVALALMYGGNWVIYSLAFVCAGILIQSKIIHARRKKKENPLDSPFADDKRTIVEKSQDEVCEAMSKITEIYGNTLTGLFNEDRKLLKEAMRESEKMYAEAHDRKHQILPILRQLEKNNVSTGHYYVQMVDYINECAKALVHITRPSFEHIDNNHQGLSKDQIEDLRYINDQVMGIYNMINDMMKNKDFSDIDKVLVQRDMVFDIFAQAIKRQVKRVIDNNTSSRGSILYLAIINETKTMLLQSRNLLKSLKDFTIHGNMEING